jgi:DNA topoisomerase-2
MALSTNDQRKTHREHILDLPDTYVGSIVTGPEEVFVRDGDNFKSTEVAFNPGFYKLVDELLVNAHDHVIRLRQKNSENPVKHIEVYIVGNGTTFTIRNDGEPIDVAQHPEHKVWIPQMIFGELLTSANYNKDEKKLVGGKNGYGVKLVNIFAREMAVEVIDQPRGLAYSQVFKKNMTEIEKPTIKKSKHKSLVSVSWIPDFARFGMANITEEMQHLIERRVYDLAMTLGKDVKVSSSLEI